MENDYSININNNEYILEIEKEPDIAIELNEQGPPGSSGNGIDHIEVIEETQSYTKYRIVYTDQEAGHYDYIVYNGEKGDTGKTGNGISGISKTGSSGIVDTYTITLTNGDTETFTVTNGRDGIDGQDGTDGYSPTATVTKSGNTTTISITDKDGTTTETIKDGIVYQDGTGIDISNDTISVADYNNILKNDAGPSNLGISANNNTILMDNTGNKKNLYLHFSSAQSSDIMALIYNGLITDSLLSNNIARTSDIPTQASDIGALSDTTTINDLTTESQQNAINSGANTTNIGQIATNTQDISNEVLNRQSADNNLQSQIDALVVASDVFDIVGTYAELQAYNISTVPVNDIIKVLVDGTHNNAATYYRCVENNNVKSWSYIGAEGAYYTKSEADSRFVEQTTTINGHALSNNITLNAEDVGALPDSTTIGNGTITITQGGTTKGTFTTNQSGNATIDLDAGGGSSTDVQINGTSITSGGVADIITEGVYDATDNKIATMSDLADKQDVLTAGTNINIVSAPPIPPVDTRSTATVSTVGNTTFTWQEVAYYNGKYIAVGNNGYVVISTDGETWGTPFTVGSAKWRGITYGNGVYVICGSDRQIAYTTDLANWTSVTVGEGSSNREWMDVIYANNQFYAVSDWGALTTSTDGENWETPTIIKSSGNLLFQAITYANGLFIILAVSNVYISSDGVNWTRISVGSKKWSAVTYAFGKYVIAGASHYMSYSTDGSTWATPFQVGTGDWQELIFGNGCIVAVGNSGNTSISTDGITWETPVKIGSSDWYGLACNGNDYVAVGTSGKVTNFEIAPEQDGGTVINGAEIVSSVDSTSTDSQCVGAKLFYDTVGDIETLLSEV